jgi:hypothetical protein
MADLNTRDLQRILNNLKRRNCPAVHEISRCSTRIGDLVCSLPVGHDDTTGLDHYDARQHRFFRFVPDIPRPTGSTAT